MKKDIDTGKCKAYIDFALAFIKISRELTEKEYNKYKEVFEKVIPNIKSGELRLVHYCYYNGVDEPSVWNLEEI